MASRELDAVDSSLQQACPDTMSLEQLLEQLDLDGIPTRQRASLVPQGGNSLTVTVQKRAWKEANISIDNAGEIETYHYPKHGLLLLDLNSHEPSE